MDSKNLIYILIYICTLTVLFQSPVLCQEIESNKETLIIQGGFFDAKKTPSIRGWQTLNIGYIMGFDKKYSWGVELLTNKGANNKIITKEAFGLDTTTVLIGGNQSYFELEVNVLLTQKLLSKNKFSFGLMYTLGFNTEFINADPDPYGFERKDKISSSRVGINSFLNFDLSQRISLLFDLNLLQYYVGQEEIKSTSLQFGDSDIRVGLVDGYLLNHLHFGLAFKL